VTRLAHIDDKLVSNSQTTFIPGQNIMDGVVMLYETIHELH
jgi:hypothetical protein